MWDSHVELRMDYHSHRPLPAKYLNNYQNKVHVATSGNLGLKSHGLEPKAVDDLGST